MAENVLSVNCYQTEPKNTMKGSEQWRGAEITSYISALFIVTLNSILRNFFGAKIMCYLAILAGLPDVTRKYIFKSVCLQMRLYKYAFAVLSSAVYLEDE